MTKGIEYKVLEKLKMLEEKEASLPISLAFYRKLISIQSSVKQGIGIPAYDLSPEAIDERMRAGRPMLEFDKLTVNWSLVQNAFEQVRELLSSYPEARAVIAGNPELYGSFSKEGAKAWFEGVRLSFINTNGDANQALREFMIHAAFSPVLIAYQEAVSSRLNQELWRRGYCPICGGSPDFSFLDKERGARWLLCSRCDAEWLFKRLECPFCGTQNQNDLTYFTDDKGFYRLYVCDHCHGYLKAIDMRQTDEEVLLPLERFLTFRFDIQAQNSGYKPMAGAYATAGFKEDR